jgi:peptidoglycan hydrolase-like protein with peptidoglycan-binding domain
MEQQEKTSGKVLFESLRKQFQKLVPQKLLRVLIVFGSILLTLGVIVGIVCGSLAIARCGTSHDPVTGEAVEAAVVQPAVPIPGLPNDTVVVKRPTEEPTAIPATLPPATQPPETPEPTPDPNEPTNYLEGRMLKKGDSDELIRNVQAILMELGYMDFDEPTDYFGNQTLEALTTFQRHNDLLADGVLGETTYALLVSGQAKEYVMQEGDEGDDVKEVQDRLYELGYLDKGSRTGVFGEKTAAAIRSFQSNNNLKVDGKVGSKTLNTLYSGDVVGNYFKSGDKDENVIRYQQRLVKLGYLESSYECKGKMDGKTVNAIKEFQEANGLVRDGCLGPATMEQIDSKNAVAYAMRLGMSGSKIRTAQQRLVKLGYLRSSQITGYYGETTVDAVKSFQKRNGLSQSGEINAKTQEKMNSDKAKAAQTASVKKTPTPKPGTKKTPTPKPTAKTTPKLSGVEKFISIAETKVGCKYVRGAKGPNQFDCSGFVFWCMNQAGVKQSYMTSIMWRTCTKYKRINSMSSIKRGDVLVFKGSSMATGHVGIYLGNGKMIDASSSRGQVRITDNNILNSKYWQSHFLMAYRIWD